MATRPAVLPETYSGEGSFTDWLDHFESVAVVNDWDDAARILWLRVRLVGRAQSAFKHLSEEQRGDYKLAKSGLKERFEPESKCALYEAEFQSRRKQHNEDWASFGEDIKSLADRAFPDLDEKARERLALNHFLSQLDSMLAFNVRKSKPKTIMEAITSTLELESYRTAPSNPAQPPAFVDAVQTKQDALMDVVQQLTNRMDKLEMEMKKLNQPRQQEYHDRPPRCDRPKQPIICRRCGKEGHYARGCAASRHTDQGNDEPSSPGAR